MTMGEEMDIAIISRTQETLGKWLKKPPLTEKLLRKPPFKFLHDIITTVINTTGFMQDLYGPDDLKSDNIKDKDSKIEFLQKAVDHIALVTGEPPNLRPNKTVAGHEADRTNLFLQALARAVNMHKEHMTEATKEKSASVKSPIKNSGRTDKKEMNESDRKEKKEHLTEATKEKLASVKNSGRTDKKENNESDRKEKKTNRLESPKAVSNKQSTADKSRTTKTSKLNDRDSGTAAEKSSKSRRTENGDTRRSKSKDKSPEKAKEKIVDGSRAHRSSVHRSEGSKDKIKSTKERTDATKDKADSGRKERERDRKENGKTEKEIGRESRKDKKESGRETKESTKEINSNSAEQLRRRRDAREKDRQMEDGKIQETRTSISHSPKKRGPAVEGDIINSPKKTGNRTADPVIDVNGDSTNAPESLVNGDQPYPPARPSTARLSAGQESNRRLTNEMPSIVPYHDDKTLTNGELTTELQSHQSFEEMNGSVEPEVIKRPSTSTIRKSSARPSTARPAAPKVRVVGTAQEELPSKESVAVVANIIMDDDNKDDDDNDGFKVEESENVLNELEQSSRMAPADNLHGKEHGSLVTQILETKKDLEMGSLRPVTGFRGTHVDKQPISDSTKRKERELFCLEMEKLQKGVQTVTRCANPLGKLVDYLQEDVDTMLRELDMWTLETQKYETNLQKEQSKVDLELESLQNRLQDVEEGIEIQVAKICAVKANIIRNEERIKKMVSLERP